MENFQFLKMRKKCLGFQEVQEHVVREEHGGSTTHTSVLEQHMSTVPPRRAQGNHRH